MNGFYSCPKCGGQHFGVFKKGKDIWCICVICETEFLLAKDEK